MIKIKNNMINAAILLLAVSLCGCQIIQNNGNEITDIYVDENIENISSTKVDLTDIPSKASVLCSYDDNIVYLNEIGSANQVVTDESLAEQGLYVYNILTKKSEYITSVGQVFSSTGDALYYDGKIYYPCVSSGKNQILLEVDLNSGDVRNIISRNKDILFSYIKQIENSLILFSINIISADETEYIIEKISPDTGDLDILIQKSVVGLESQWSGEFISCIDVFNNYIYTYGQNDKNEIMINRYTDEGELNNTYMINQLDAFLSPDADNVEDGFTDTVWEMNVIEDYIVLKTINKRHCLFKINENELEQISIPEVLYSEIPGDFQYIKKLDNHRIYFSACYIEENNLYILDTEKNTFKIYSLPVGNNYEKMPVYVTHSGSMVLRSLQNDSDETLYLLSGDAFY